MLLSGFTFIRNARKFDFPVLECIESMLPIVDELVVNVGNSDDDTETLIRSIKSPKLKIIMSSWDDANIKSGLVLSEQTNIALDACKGRWALYLQADEALHENEHELIRREVEAADKEENPPDGLRFRYLHFYGGYTFVQRPWNWYPSEIRVIRRASGARSHGDAQTFRLIGEQGVERELRTRQLDAHVFHYGHARAPETMARKITYFHRFWHGDDHGIKVDDGQPYHLDLKNLVWFWGTHPAPYRTRVEEGMKWSPSPAQVAGAPFRNVVIFTSKQNWELALKLKEFVEKRTPGSNVGVVTGFAQWVKAILKLSLKRPTSALVDLYAEERSLTEFLLWVLDPVTGFRWRIAHAPRGRLSRFRARFYTAVNWGGHEETEKGFRVPEQAQLAQLARWLGLN